MVLVVVVEMGSALDSKLLQVVVALPNGSLLSNPAKAKWQLCLAMCQVAPAAQLSNHQPL